MYEEQPVAGPTAPAHGRRQGAGTVVNSGGREMSEPGEDGAPETGDDAKAAWQKAKLPSLAPSATAEEALAEIVLGGVAHLRGNENCVLTRSHEEGVHQMRVAVRRLRSCLALYERFIPDEQRIYLTGEMKWLIGELGPARDWDVFVGEVMAPVIGQVADEPRLDELAEQVERHRDEAYARAQTAVGAQRYIGLVLLLNSWAEGRGWREGDADRLAAIQVTATDVSHELLDEICQQVLEAGAGFEDLDADQRHKVRIQLKQLRYATEFFATLYPKRRVSPYLEAMKSLQDQLGVSNDVEVARKLLKRVVKKTRGKERVRLSYAAGLVVGWHSHVGGGREKEQVEAWQQLISRTPYWQAAGEAAKPQPEPQPASPPPDDQAPTPAPVAPSGTAKPARPPRSPRPRNRVVRPG